MPDAALLFVLLVNARFANLFAATPSEQIAVADQAPGRGFGRVSVQLAFPAG